MFFLATKLMLNIIFKLKINTFSCIICNIYVILMCISFLTFTPCSLCIFHFFIIHTFKYHIFIEIVNIAIMYLNAKFVTNTATHINTNLCMDFACSIEKIAKSLIPCCEEITRLYM